MSLMGKNLSIQDGRFKVYDYNTSQPDNGRGNAQDIINPNIGLNTLVTPGNNLKINNGQLQIDQYGSNQPPSDVFNRQAFSN